MIPKDLLKVIAIPGQSGFEYEIREFLMEEFTGLGAKVTLDKLGSVICKFEGKARDTGNRKKIAIFAHMDTCGFIVHSIRRDGLVKVVNFGYSNVKACHLVPVAIKTSLGYIKGIIYASEYNGKVLFEVDVGVLGYTEVMKLGIKAGDPVHFINEPILMGHPGNVFVCAPRLDNRIGVFELLLLAQYYSRNQPIDDLYLVATVEEEFGSRGAKTSVNKIRPDFAIVFDTTYHEHPVYISQGPVLTLSDRGIVISDKVRDYLLKLARKYDLTVQTEVWNFASTDAINVRQEMTGVPTISILTATKNSHTPCEIASIDDIYDVVEYTKGLIENTEEIIEQFEIY